MDFISHYSSPLGGITLASDGTYLVGLWFDGQKYYASTLNKEHEERHDLPVFEQTRRWLDLYFSGAIPDFTPALLMRTCDFRCRVWEILLTIPYGHTMTYGEIARIIAREKGLKNMSAQAIGNAVSHNPISLIIPCHRVIGANGSLTGYAGGIERKRWLLERETYPIKLSIFHPQSLNHHRSNNKHNAQPEGPVEFLQLAEKDGGERNAVNGFQVVDQVYREGRDTTEGV